MVGPLDFAPVPLEPPAYIQGEALAEWQRVVGILKDRNLLGSVDRASIAIYCSAWGKLVQAEAHIAQHGPVVATPRTGVPMVNPYTAVASEAARQIAACKWLKFIQ